MTTFTPLETTLQLLEQLTENPIHELTFDEWIYLHAIRSRLQDLPEKEEEAEDPPVSKEEAIRYSDEWDWDANTFDGCEGADGSVYLGDGVYL